MGPSNLSRYNTYVESKVPWLENTGKWISNLTSYDVSRVAGLFQRDKIGKVQIEIQNAVKEPGALEQLALRKVSELSRKYSKTMLDYIPERKAVQKDQRKC